MAEAQAHAVAGIPAHTALQLISQVDGAVRVVIARRPTYFPWVFYEVPEVFRWSPQPPMWGGDGTVCTIAKPPQSCFWMTIICFDGPQTRSICARSTVIPTRP